MTDQDQGDKTQDPQDQNTGDTGGGSDAGGQEQTVPVSVVQSIRKEKQEAQQKAEEYEQRLRQLEAQAQGGQQGGQSQDQNSDDPLAGLDDDEPLTAAQVRKLREQDRQYTETVMAEMRMRQQFSDYDEVIKNDLTERLKEEPELADAIQTSKNPFLLAYRMGKDWKNQKPSDQGNGSDGSPGAGGSETQSELEAALDKQQQKPGSASQAASSTQTPQSGEEKYKDQGRRSPEDLDKEIQDVKRGAQT